MGGPIGRSAEAGVLASNFCGDPPRGFILSQIFCPNFYFVECLASTFSVAVRPISGARALDQGGAVVIAGLAVARRGRAAQG